MATTGQTPDATKPWYRHPWVWVLIAIPASAVVFGAVMLYLAMTTYDGLVVDDYYKHGKEINRTLARDRAASRHDLTTRLEFDYGQHTVTMRMRARNDYTLPERVRLQLLHPTRKGMDHSLELQRTPDSGYFSALPALAPARWYLLLEADDWRLVGTLQVPEIAAVEINARP